MRLAPPSVQLLARNFTVLAPNRTWVSDITYIPTLSRVSVKVGQDHIIKTANTLSRRNLNKIQGTFDDRYAA